MSSSFSKLFMRPSRLNEEEKEHLSSIHGGIHVYVTRKKTKEKILAPFNTIREGDYFFINGTAYKCGSNAQYYNGPRYQGYIVFDVDGQVWYPQNLDGKEESNNE